MHPEPGMKLISSLVRPDKVNNVKQALAKVGVYGLKLWNMHDHAPQKHDTTVWRGHEYSPGFSLKTQIEVVVHDDDVDAVVNAIIRTARTGQEGDGYVLVLPVEHRHNIHNGNRDVT